MPEEVTGIERLKAMAGTKGKTQVIEIEKEKSGVSPKR